MDLQKYDGNVHPDEWINNIRTYFNNSYGLNTAKSLVDSTIQLPTGIDSFEKLLDVLREDISFTVFKNTNKRKLRSLKYIPERKGGDTSKFISTFRKLCYNAEINDTDEQMKYLYQSLPDNEYYTDFLTEFYNKMKNVHSINEIIKEFEEIVMEESNLIRNGSIIALKHVATGKYLSSIEDLHYTTGSGAQSVFAGSTKPVPNSMWEIDSSNEYTTYTDSNIYLRHVKSANHLGIYYHYNNSNGYCYYFTAPSTEHAEVCCYSHNNIECRWKFNNSRLENHQRYLKSNDIINLSIKKSINNQYGFLRSDDTQFTIGNNSYQEVICHNESLGENDEWCVELIRQAND